MSTNVDSDEIPSHRSRPKPDFIGELKYLNSEEGGRSKPAHSGYRPHFKLPYKEWLTSCNQEFIDLTVVNPGDTVNAEMKILWIEAFEHCLAPGDQFTLGELSRVIANGTIKEVLNPRLRREHATTDPLDGMRYLFFNEPNTAEPQSESRLKRGVQKAALTLASSIFPRSNPVLGHLYGKVTCWKIEFDLTNNWTAKEIGYDEKGKAIVAAPFKKDLGLWTDHELSLEDYERFKPTVITKEEFEEDWLKFNT